MKVERWFMSLKGQEVGDFVLNEYVGHGKIGYVYRASFKSVPDLERAVKLTPGRPRQGWENELQKVAKLSTIPGVVHFHHLGTAQISFEGNTEILQYTVWDYIPPGRNLRDYLEEIDTCPTSFLLAVIEQVLRVLHACYAKGLRHGDLHAGNILIGETDVAELDSSLQPREPIYVSDFGYGTTGGGKKPKDDYIGLAEIVNVILQKVEWDAATVTDRQILGEVRNLTSKLFREPSASERRTALEILQIISDIKRKVHFVAGARQLEHSLQSAPGQASAPEAMNVGQFQVSEMLGDDWKWWKHLFVSTVPARSRILAPDISTVVTGPRGCGKTMLFRRLSERLMVECGPVDSLPDASNFVGLYVNANDIADAFAKFPLDPTPSDTARLICYTNLCILSDILAVQSAHFAKSSHEPSEEFLSSLKEWFVGDGESFSLVVGENSLERYRFVLEKIKRRFPTSSDTLLFPGFADLSQHTYLRRLIGN